MTTTTNERSKWLNMCVWGRGMPLEDSIRLSSEEMK
jgi:hypothetical protein